MGYRTTRSKLWRHWPFERQKESNQNIGAINSIHPWNIRSWSSVARRWMKLPNNSYSAMGQLKSLERRLQKDTLQKSYQETNDTDLKAGFVRKVEQMELNDTIDKLQSFLPHHPVIKPHKPGKVRRVWNASAKYQSTALNDQLLPGPDLLHSLIGIIIRFREHKIALSVDIEAIFHQVAVPSDDNRCLQFLWREDPEQRIKIYENTWHVFGVMSSPTCAKYALHQVT